MISMHKLSESASRLVGRKGGIHSSHTYYRLKRAYLSPTLLRTNGRKETPLYLFLLLHFGTSLVEDGLIVHQFVLTHHHTEHTEFLCRWA